MTREEIEKMEIGRELDDLVAQKLLGWKWNTARKMWMDREQNVMWRGYFHPSTDIAAAWKLVEELGLTVQPSGQYPYKRWIAGKKDADHEIYWTDLFEEGAAPLAICKVALFLTCVA